MHSKKQCVAYSYQKKMKQISCTLKKYEGHILTKNDNDKKEEELEDCEGYTQNKRKMKWKNNDKNKAIEKITIKSNKIKWNIK